MECQLTNETRALEGADTGDGECQLTTKTMALEGAGTADGEIELQFDVRSLSGNGGNVYAKPSDALQELLAQVQELVGLPVDCQRWFLDQKEISLKGAATFAETGICDGDRVTVMHGGSVDVPPLPSVFDLTFTSARERLRMRRYSSAFSIVHKMHVNTPAGILRHEPWRKNDHDSIAYDVIRRTKTLSSGHWMTGTSQNVIDLPEDSDPIGNFLQSWPKQVTPVWDPCDRFWRSCDAKISDDVVLDEASKDDSHPIYPDVPGMFVLPSENCVEVHTDIPVGTFENLSISRKVVRLLLDENGTPIRAALNSCRLGNLHKEIEEYDIKLEHVGADVSSCAGQD